jgi:16S rRNA (guanine966-N2)-methyltransferase
MRIIAGTAKGRRLKAPKTWDVRPTADRVKESLFNIISNKKSFEDKHFLDLFAGTGNVGIEALSRGIRYAYFVEKEPQNIKIIVQNLTNAGFEAKSQVIKADVLEGIKKLSRKGIKFDFVFLDPPYNRQLVTSALTALEAADIINPEGIVVVEHHRDEQPKESFGKIRLFDQRTYGETRISFFVSITK